MQFHHFFGDSLTEWAPWQALFSHHNISNHGIAGNTLADMLARTHHVPTQGTVWIMGGINDFIQGASVDLVFQRYQQLLDFWRHQPVEIQSTLKAGHQFTELNRRVESLNFRLQQEAIRRHIRFHDINKLLNADDALSDEHTYDGVHLTDKAYQCWGKYINNMLSV